jgi:hypothetical protein
MVDAMKAHNVLIVTTLCGLPFRRQALIGHERRVIMKSKKWTASEKAALIGGVAVILAAVIGFVATRSQPGTGTTPSRIDPAPAEPGTPRPELTATAVTTPPLCPGSDARDSYLTPAPTSWGKRIQGASGTVTYCEKSAGVFTGNVALIGLDPGKTYTLCINGKPGHPSNEWLPDRRKAGRYYDFAQTPADRTGRIAIPFKVALHAGDYDVKFFVKDSEDSKIVLFNDRLLFRVQ